MNGDKLAPFLGAFLCKKIMIARGLREPKYTLKRYKRAFK